MDLIEEMWISRPQRRMTKLSDLSDGSIARIKFYNAKHSIYNRLLLNIL